MADGCPAEQGRTKQYIKIPPPEDIPPIATQLDSTKDAGDMWRNTEATVLAALTGINLTEKTAREAVAAMRKAGVCFFIPKV